MPLIIASNFGNLYTFYTGVPTLLLAITLGAIGVALRIRALSAVGALLCVGCCVWFLVSLPNAVEADRFLTIAFGTGSILAGVSLLLFKRAPHPKKEADPDRQRTTRGM